MWGREDLRGRIGHHHLDTCCLGANQAPTPLRPAPTTTVAERLAHWREVVRTMDCPEVTDLELKRLAGDFEDRAESLTAIHDRQGELNCA